MGKIFCVMGKSGSGKDTLFKEIKDDDTLGLKPIISYTTRPKRSNETHGVEYYFIDEERLEEYEKMGKVIEVRKYYTVKGKWCYGTIDDGQIDLDNNDYIIIVTLEAYNSLQKYFGANKIIPIYINLDDGVRLERALKRERSQSHPNYNEMCRRFLADSEDFSNAKLKESGVNNSFENYDLDKCIESIKAEIRRYK